MTLSFIEEQWKLGYITKDEVEYFIFKWLRDNIGSEWDKMIVVLARKMYPR